MAGRVHVRRWRHTATELGVEVCAPVHDALLIHAPAEKIEDAVAVTRDAMTWAAEVTRGIGIRTDVKLVRYPDRYMDDRGRVMWSTVWSLLGGEPFSSLVEGELHEAVLETEKRDLRARLPADQDGEAGHEGRGEKPDAHQKACPMEM